MFTHTCWDAPRALTQQRYSVSDSAFSKYKYVYAFWKDCNRLISLIHAFHFIPHFTGMNITFIPLQGAPSGAYGMTFSFVKQFSLCFCTHDVFLKDKSCISQCHFCLDSRLSWLFFLHGPAAKIRIPPCQESHRTEMYKTNVSSQRVLYFPHHKLSIMIKMVSTYMVSQQNCLSFSTQFTFSLFYYVYLTYDNTDCQNLSCSKIHCRLLCIIFSCFPLRYLYMVPCRDKEYHEYMISGSFPTAVAFSLFADLDYLRWRVCNLTIVPLNVHITHTMESGGG